MFQTAPVIREIENRHSAQTQGGIFGDDIFAGNKDQGFGVDRVSGMHMVVRGNKAVHADVDIGRLVTNHHVAPQKVRALAGLKILRDDFFGQEVAIE